MRSTVSRARVEGVVVRLATFGDAHRVVELLSPTHGRLALVARGARASKKRFAGVLDAFASLRCEVELAPTGLSTLVSADLENLRLGIRRSLEGIERAASLSQLAQRLAPEHAHADRLHDSLVLGLDALDRGELAPAAGAYLGLLVAAGIGPDLTSCAACGAKDPTRGALVAELHGLVCPSCARGRTLLSAAALACLATGVCTDLAAADEAEQAALAWATALALPSRQRTR